MTEDPDVAMYTKVSSCVLLPSTGGFAMYSGAFSGFFYVRGSRLYYDTKVGSRFWCSCVGLDWDLADIGRVEAVTGSVKVISRHGIPRTLTMNPGLKITFKTNGSTMVTAMPDAVNFCAKLKQYMVAPQPVENVKERSCMNKMARFPPHPLTHSVPKLTIIRSPE
jgi:hypothetical protein